MSTSDEQDGRRRVLPAFLLAVTNDGARLAACRSALKTLPGVQLQHFTDPRAALEWAERNAPVAVVVDHTLPSMDGLAFARGLHGSASSPRPHVIMLGGDTSAGATEAAREAGIDDVLPKSAPGGTFAALVQSAIGLRLAERALWDSANVFDQRAASAVEQRAAAARVQAAAFAPPVTPEKPTSPRRLAAAAALVAVLLLLAVVFHLHHRSPTTMVAAATTATAQPSAGPSGSVSPTAGVPTPAPAAAAAPANAPDASAASPPAALAGPANGLGAAGAGAGAGGAGVPGTAAGAAASSANGKPAGAPAAHGSAAVAAAAAARPLTDPNSGFLVLDGAGKPVSAYNADVPRVPASTVKVITAAAAIATLGAQFHFTTTLAARAVARDGIIDGPLALVGGGDPVLSMADLDGAAASLEQAGVRRIHGDLVIDATAFTSPEYNAGWPASDRSQPYAAGTSAVSIDEGTQSAGSGPPAVRAVADQQAYAGVVLRRLLTAHGIAVDGSTTYGRFQGSTILWQHQSPPLSALVNTMLVESDNHVAEQLVRETGLTASGVGSESAGLTQIRSYLAAHHVPTAGLQLYDGSGLSPNDRLTPRTLATLLWRIEGTREGEQIHASLPSIETPADRAPADARDLVVAKTGRVGTARGLAGYLDRAPEGSLSFAFLGVAEPNVPPHALRQNQEELLHRLARLGP